MVSFKSGKREDYCIGRICVLLMPCTLEVEQLESRNTVHSGGSKTFMPLWPSSTMLGRSVEGPLKGTRWDPPWVGMPGRERGSPLARDTSAEGALGRLHTKAQGSIANPAVPRTWHQAEGEIRYFSAFHFPQNTNIRGLEKYGLECNLACICCELTHTRTTYKHSDLWSSSIHNFATTITLWPNFQKWPRTNNFA